MKNAIKLLVFISTLPSTANIQKIARKPYVFIAKHIQFILLLYSIILT